MLSYFLKILTTEDPIIIILKLTEFVMRLRSVIISTENWIPLTIPKL